MVRRTSATPNRAVANALWGFLSEIPATDELPRNAPAIHARTLTHAAAKKSALISGTLALPPGPLGLLTIVPDLVAIWRIQACLVADIAAVFGKHGSLTREQMLYCLFRHAASQVLRDVVVRTGERVLVRQTSVRAMQQLVSRVGVNVTQRVLAKSASRWIVGIGALAVGAYAYYDTKRVGSTAENLFSATIEITNE